MKKNQNGIIVSLSRGVMESALFISCLSVLEVTSSSTNIDLDQFIKLFIQIFIFQRSLTWKYGSMPTWRLFSFIHENFAILLTFHRNFNNYSVWIFPNVHFTVLCLIRMVFWLNFNLQNWIDWIRVFILSAHNTFQQVIEFRVFCVKRRNAGETLGFNAPSLFSVKVAKPLSPLPVVYE